MVISIIVPCLNEAGNIKILYKDLVKSISNLGFDMDLIFINDGSTDGTLDEIKSICEKDGQTRYISFTRNFGQQAALLAGLRASKGDVVIMMDADLQHPVELLPLLLNKWREGYDIVNTRRIQTDGISLLKNWSSTLFYFLMNKLTDINIKNGEADFKLLDRRVVDVIKDSEEYHLFIRGLLKWTGFKETSVDYIACLRYSGKTKYTLTKMLRLSLDGITSFSVRPLRLSLIFAFFCLFVTFAELSHLLYITFCNNEEIPGWSIVFILISSVGAMVLFVLGILGEYLGRIFLQSKGRPHYVISSTNF